MILREIYARSILSRSQVFDYVVNPYIGCQHGCTYCYARSIKRFTRHEEPWGQFIDIKINAPALLIKQIGKAARGRVWVSGLCDPYQPLEGRYELTKKCLEILIEHDWPVTVQTKSPLVLRDLNLLKQSSQIEVGLSVTTADDEIRKLFEPGAPPIQERLKALEQMRAAGIKTYAMVAPLLPGAGELPLQLDGKVDYVLVDRMNYHYADWAYRKYHLEEAMSYDFFLAAAHELSSAFAEQGVKCRVLF